MFFIRLIGKEFKIQDKAAIIADKEEKRYYSEIEKMKKKLQGKKVLIEDKFTQNIDWLIELVLDLGMDIVIVGIGPIHHWKEKRPESKYLSAGIPFRYDYTLEEMMSDIDLYSPDIVLSDSGLTELDKAYHTTYSRPGPGLNGVLNYGRKFLDLISVPKREGWRELS